jgi:hypothetical protein
MSKRHDPRRASAGISQSNPKRDGKEYLPQSNFSVSSLSRVQYDFKFIEQQMDFKTRSIANDMHNQAVQTLANHSFRHIEHVIDPKDHKRHELNYAFWLAPEAAPLTIFNTHGDYLQVTKETPEAFPQRLLKKIKASWQPTDHSYY